MRQTRRTRVHRSGAAAAIAARACLASLALAGCHKSEAPPTTPAAPGAAAPSAAPPAAAGTMALHVDGTPHTDAVENAWRAAGLAPEGFASVQPIPYGASICEEGRVQGVDTTVCEFRDADALTKGQAAILDQWGREGGHTGVALHAKLTMVGLVDRGRADPNGKVIHQALDAFRKL